jgi:hypothetical protein
VLALRAIVSATVGISWLSQRDMPTDLKPGRSKIRLNLSFFLSFFLSYLPPDHFIQFSLRMEKNILRVSAYTE